jgi:hypothetical protein
MTNYEVETKSSGNLKVKLYEVNYPVYKLF